MQYEQRQAKQYVSETCEKLMFTWVLGIVCPLSVSYKVNTTCLCLVYSRHLSILSAALLLSSGRNETRTNLYNKGEK